MELDDWLGFMTYFIHLNPTFWLDILVLSGLQPATFVAAQTVRPMACDGHQLSRGLIPMFDGIILYVHNLWWSPEQWTIVSDVKSPYICMAYQNHQNYWINSPFFGGLSGLISPHAPKFAALRRSGATGDRSQSPAAGDAGEFARPP